MIYGRRPYSDLPYSSTDKAAKSGGGGGTTPSRTGTAAEIGALAASGSIGITVPADCNAVIAMWSHWQGNNNSTLSSATINGVGFTVLQQFGDDNSPADAPGVGVAILLSPATGSQTFAWSWSNGLARNEGGWIVLTYIKDANISDAVRGYAIEQGGATTNVEVTLATASTDLLIAVGQSFTTGGPPVLDGTLYINDTLYNSQRYDASQITPGSPTTTVTMTGESFSSMAAISLKPSGGGPPADDLIAQARTVMRGVFSRIFSRVN